MVRDIEKGKEMLKIVADTRRFFNSVRKRKTGTFADAEFSLICKCSACGSLCLSFPASVKVSLRLSGLM